MVAAVTFILIVSVSPVFYYFIFFWVFEFSLLGCWCVSTSGNLIEIMKQNYWLVLSFLLGNRGIMELL